MKIEWFKETEKWRMEIKSFATLFNDVDMSSEEFIGLLDGGSTKYDVGRSQYAHSIGGIILSKINISDWNKLLKGLID